MAILPSLSSIFRSSDRFAQVHGYEIQETPYHPASHPSIYRRPGLLQPRLDVQLSQPSQEWSRDTHRLLETASRRHRSRPLPLVSPLRSPPAPPLPPPPSSPPPPIPPRAPGRRKARITDTQVVTTPDDEPMDLEAVKVVIDCIGKLFKGMVYAVCGHAAMVYWGLEDCRPVYVSLIWQHETDVAHAWALSKGMIRVPGRPNVFRINTPDGHVRRIYIRHTPPSSWNRTISRVGPYQTSVLALPGIVDHIADKYTSSLETASAPQKEAMAKAMRWALGRIPELEPSVHRLRSDLVPHVVEREFWIPFTLSFPDCLPLFAAAGLQILTEGDEKRRAQRADHVTQTEAQQVPSRQIQAPKDTQPPSLLPGRVNVGRSSVATFDGAENLAFPLPPRAPWLENSIPSPRSSLENSGEVRPGTAPNGLLLMSAITTVPNTASPTVSPASRQSPTARNETPQGTPLRAHKEARPEPAGRSTWVAPSIISSSDFLAPRQAPSPSVTGPLPYREHDSTSQRPRGILKRPATPARRA